MLNGSLGTLGSTKLTRMFLTTLARNGALQDALVVSAEGRGTEVSGLYHELLGRAPTTGELSYWTGLLRTATTERLIATLVSSEEYFVRVTT